MEYQKITKNDESNKPSKFKTRNWVEINDEARGTYSPNKQIKFKTSMITVNNTAVAADTANNTNKKVIFKNFAPFTNCISKINNAQIDDEEYIYIVMAMYNLDRI